MNFQSVKPIAETELILMQKFISTSFFFLFSRLLEWKQNSGSRQCLMRIQCCKCLYKQFANWQVVYVVRGSISEETGPQQRGFRCKCGRRGLRFFFFASEGEAALRGFHSPHLSGWSRLLPHLHATCCANGLTSFLMYTIAVIFLWTSSFYIFFLITKSCLRCHWYKMFFEATAF